MPTSANVSGYSRDRLLSNLEKLPTNGQITLALDACFTGSAKNGEVIVAGAKAQFRKTNQPRLPNNVTLISSSQADQVSWGNDQIGHSVMTYFFLQGLEGKADKNQNGQISKQELSDYLKQEVNRFSLRHNNQAQQPEIISNNQTEQLALD